jgi:anti-anti-sigma regulatory factor
LATIKSDSVEEQTNFIVLNAIRNALLATVQVSLTPQVIEEFKLNVLNRVKHEKYKHFLIDLSGLELMDFDEYKKICQIMDMVSLMGVESVVIGMRPEVVASLVEHDIGVIYYTVALNIEDAFNKINLNLNESIR